MTFRVWSGAAERLWICLFDPVTGSEIDSIGLAREHGGRFTAAVPGLAAGARYGLRADGPHAPEQGLWFDPSKLLVDPYAFALDRPFAHDPRLAAPRAAEIDTARLVPKAVVTQLPPPVTAQPPVFKPGGFIYEIPVRAFTMLHPDVPPDIRGTVAALGHPAIVDHLTRLGVDAVELMPITAWIDERHLGPLGLTNGWGYNPVAFMAPDPRLCPGGIAELRATVETLRAAGIGVILDVVFNHTGESDAGGPTLSLRGLDARAYFRHSPDGSLVNDTGTGNTLACDHPATRALILDALRHFVRHAGVDGFRFDLAPVLGRTDRGFDPAAPLLREIADDPDLGQRILIAEPWDIGPGGYQLGRFPAPFLEWNDRARDRIRRFWRGDPGALADFATALAGSSDVFAPPRTRTVNFIAAHDGFTFRDLVSHARKHNRANGEDNRDGHDDNFSWNSGAEGPSDRPELTAARAADVRALLATLFASRGTIMLTAGDEFGRTQGGNNNAYAQDNATTWLDWASRDRDLEALCATVSAWRRSHPELGDPRLLSGAAGEDGVADVAWLLPHGAPLRDADWHAEDAGAVAMVLATRDGGRLAVLVNRGHAPVTFHLPPRPGRTRAKTEAGRVAVPGRSVTACADALGESAPSPDNRQSGS